MFGQIHFLILKNIYNNIYLENKDYGSDRIKEWILTCESKKNYLGRDEYFGKSFVIEWLYSNKTFLIQ